MMLDLAGPHSEVDWLNQATQSPDVYISMRILLQRVNCARVLVEGKVVGSIGPGLVLLIGIHEEDSEKQVIYCADKCAHLRIFPDAAGRMNRSVLDSGGQILAVSQFTLYGDTRRGRRPDFGCAANPGHAEPLYKLLLVMLEEMGLEVARGVFGAEMSVNIENDGPLTVIVESP